MITLSVLHVHSSGDENKPPQITQAGAYSVYKTRTYRRCINGTFNQLTAHTSRGLKKRVFELGLTKSRLVQDAKPLV